MEERIPQHLISIVSEILSELETHAGIDSLLLYAGAPGDPPSENKIVKVQEWLRRTNKDENVEPLKVLAYVVEKVMESHYEEGEFHYNSYKKAKSDIEKGLSRAGLKYLPGPKIISAALGTPTITLSELIRALDVDSIDSEFNRAIEAVDNDPEDAVLAACNILESIFRVYIEDEKLKVPSKKDLGSLWRPVREDLGFNPGALADDDLKRILSGLFSIIDGIGALRTHTSSAHGRGRSRYYLEGRHARLAIHAAHTLSAFVLESWEKKKKSSSE